MELKATLDAAFDDLLEAPTASARHVVRRFPYVVFFTVKDDAVEIVAVAHAKRRPGYWLRR